MYAPDGIEITASLLTIASYNHSYIRLAHFANTLCAVRILQAVCQYVMSRANAIRDTRIRYGPRECDMRYAHTLRAAQMRYAIRE